MIFQNINNATTLIQHIETKIIFDPWIIGKLYQNSWSPYPKQEVLRSWFKNVEYIYISHIDPDHWDIETIKKVNNFSNIQ